VAVRDEAPPAPGPLISHHSPGPHQRYLGLSQPPWVAQSLTARFIIKGFLEVQKKKDNVQCNATTGF